MSVFLREVESREISKYPKKVSVTPYLFFFLVFALLSAVLLTGLDMMLPLIHTEQEAEVKHG